MVYTYLIYIVPAMILSIIFQLKMKSTYAKYSKMSSLRGYTGSQMAEQVLKDNGIYDVRVEPIGGTLTDNFNPKEMVIRLSEGVYNSTSVAALGIACHEAGHAVQYHERYAPIAIRNAILPVANIGSNISWWMIILGMFITSNTGTFLIYAGIILFSSVALFQLVTLPVEFNASKRAIKALQVNNILEPHELDGTKKVLFAAAMTYVAALITSIASLLRILVLTSGRRSRR